MSSGKPGNGTIKTVTAERELSEPAVIFDSFLFSCSREAVERSEEDLTLIMPTATAAASAFSPPRTAGALNTHQSRLPELHTLRHRRSKIRTFCCLQNSIGRFSARMGLHVYQHWRKSSQWTALTRKHAQIILDDSVFYPKFERFCKSAWDSDYGRQVQLFLSC